MKTYKDDEDLIHKIFEEDSKFILESEIIVFGEFFKSKYKSKSLSKTVFDNFTDAHDELRKTTKQLSEILE